MVTESYQYHLMSAVPMHPKEIDHNNVIIRGLIWDGESLYKRLKKHNKNNNREQ